MTARRSRFSTQWPGGAHWWREDDRWHISIPFTPLLPAVKSAVTNLLGYERVIVGGPAVKLMPGFVAGWADIGEDRPDVLQIVNPDACRFSYGCGRRCSFCAVERLEGSFREVRPERIGRIVCDSNLLLAHRRHFDWVIDQLKPLRGIDFNQGLDARLLSAHHASRLAELDCLVRFSWDFASCESAVMQAIELVTSAGIPTSRIRCYVLAGHDSDANEVAYRCSTLFARGILPNVQRYTPLDSLTWKHVEPGWTNEQLEDICRWGNRAALLRRPFADYDRHAPRTRRKPISQTPLLTECAS